MVVNAKIKSKTNKYTADRIAQSIVLIAPLNIP